MRRRQTPAQRAALGGVLAAGSLAVLYCACLAPSGRMGLAALAGLFPAAALLVGDEPTGLLCWAASGLLGLLILPLRAVAAMYLLFFGLYPLLKLRLERLPRMAVRLCKLAFFNIVLVLSRLVFLETVLSGFPEWALSWQVLVPVCNGIFLLYDIGLSGLMDSLLRRLCRMPEGDGV